MTSTVQKQVLLSLTGAFFVAGFATGLNDLLVPHFKSIFSLDHARAGLVPTSFFAAYLVVSPLAGKYLRHMSAQLGVQLSLITMLLGALLFIPAALIASFPLFLVGLFILASGGTLLQFFGNPYLTAIGGAEASRTLTLVIAFTPLGTALAGPIAGTWLFSRSALSASDLIVPYALLGVLMLWLVVATRSQQWPLVAPSQLTSHKAVRWWQVAQFRWGAMAIFGYVGSEVATGSFLVAAAGLSRYGSIAPIAATKLVGIYWAGAMVGRFVGPWYMRQLGAVFSLTLHAVAALVCLSYFMLADGQMALSCLVAVGYCNSIMYPTITALTLKDTGSAAALGSAVLCTAVAGGALFPYLQGQLADAFGVVNSFGMPLVGYACVLLFAGFCRWRKV